MLAVKKIPLSKLHKIEVSGRTPIITLLINDLSLELITLKLKIKKIIIGISLGIIVLSVTIIVLYVDNIKKRIVLYFFSKLKLLQSI